MIAAGIVYVIDALDRPVGSGPDRVEASAGALGVLALAGVVGDGERAVGPLCRQCGRVAGMISKLPPERVVQLVNLRRPEHQVITRLAVQAAAPGVPVCARRREIDRVDQRGVGIRADQHRARVRSEPGGQSNSLPGLADAPRHTGRRVVGDGCQFGAVDSDGG